MNDNQWGCVYQFMIGVEKLLQEVVELLRQMKEDQDKRDRAGMYDE